MIHEALSSTMKMLKTHWGAHHVIHESDKPSLWLRPGGHVGGLMTQERLMITNIEDYFTKGCGRCDRLATVDCSAQRWADGLRALRQLSWLMPWTQTQSWPRPFTR